MKNIYVLGSLNLDFVISSKKFPEKGETIIGSDFFTNSGGKGANQAVAASKLGSNVSMIGSVGEDSYGLNLLDSLKKYDVNVANVSINEKCDTGKAFIYKDEVDNRIVIFQGCNSKIKSLQVDKGLESASKDDIFILQGETNIDIIKYGLIKAKEKEMVTIFNFAPAFEIDDVFFSYVDWLVVNESEIEFLSNIKPITIENQIKCFCLMKKKGVKNLIITLGKEGAVFFLKDKEPIWLSAYDVKSIDTTGAGDTFVGCLAHILANYSSVHNYFNYCIASSALCVTRLGAQQSMPTINEVEDFLDIHN